MVLYFSPSNRGLKTKLPPPLFYILKKVNKMCLLYKGLLLCMYIRYSKWRVWLLTHTFTILLDCQMYEIDKTVYVKRNIKAISCNHCCSGRAMSVTYSVCVFVASGTQREMRMRHCHLWRVRGLLYFFHIISLRARYSGKKKVMSHTVCVLIFPTTFVWNISHSKKNWARNNQNCLFAFV